MTATEDTDKIIDDVFHAAKIRKGLYEQYLKPYYHRCVYYDVYHATSFRRLFKDFTCYDYDDGDFLWKYSREEDLRYQDTKIKNELIIVSVYGGYDRLSYYSDYIEFEIPLNTIYKDREQLIAEYRLTDLEEIFQKWKEEAESKRDEIDRKNKQMDQLRKEISELLKPTIQK